jgi:hypothetical protein
MQELLEKVNEIRKTNGKLNFLQIGAYDGISMDDVANILLKFEDRGFFIRLPPRKPSPL